MTTVIQWACPGGCEGQSPGPYGDSEDACIVCHGDWPAERPVTDTLGRMPRGTSLRVRLFGRITVTEKGCWEFPSNNTDGYGVIKVDGSDVKAHRVSYRLALGEPGALHVLHRCDNPPCINPSHLFLGTNHQNVLDRQAKGRSVLPTNGPDFWRAKTNCPQGHPYSGENVRFRTDGRRRCAECYRIRSRRRRALTKESS